MMTSANAEVSKSMVASRLKHFINQFYKILPMRESNADTLQQYMLSLQREMIGLHSLILALENDGRYLSLLSILQYLIEHECDVRVVRAEVFKAIQIVNSLSQQYACEGE